MLGGRGGFFESRERRWSVQALSGSRWKIVGMGESKELEGEFVHGYVGGYEGRLQERRSPPPSEREWRIWLLANSCKQWQHRLISS